jgi:uracil-DNA glycosylase
VSGTDGASGFVVAEGSVFIDRAGRRLARRRLEVGGRSEGDAFTARDSPVRLLRVGGRKEGEPPLADMAISGLVVYCPF